MSHPFALDNGRSCCRWGERAGACPRPLSSVKGSKLQFEDPLGCCPNEDVDPCPPDVLEQGVICTSAKGARVAVWVGLGHAASTSLGLFSVDGGWGSWSEWSACPVTCGRGAHQTRTRLCDSPEVANGGAPCPGYKQDSRECVDIARCPGETKV